MIARRPTFSAVALMVVAGMTAVFVPPLGALLAAVGAWLACRDGHRSTGAIFIAILALALGIVLLNGFVAEQVPA